VDGPAFLGSTLNVASATQLSTLAVTGQTTLDSVNASSISVANGLIYNTFWNVYKIPDKTVTYLTTEIDQSKGILNASYVAPQSGFYNVDACLDLTSNIRTSWYTTLETSNASNQVFKYKSPYVKSTYFAPNMKEIVKLNKGEAVSVAVYCGANINLTTTGSVFRTSLMTQF
jgi:hypothetical protein